MMIRVDTEREMEAFGRRLAAAVGPGAVIHLCGPLGAGKTTLVRGMLRALGHRGPVKSPTYTLVESYSTDRLTLHHFDLYRVADPEELELIGMRDYLENDAACLVEWPERGPGVAPPADLCIEIAYAGSARDVRCTARSEAGRAMLQQVAE